MRVGLLVMAVLVGVVLGFQIVYVRTYAANANGATKVVWGVNLALLVVLLLALVAFALLPVVD